ncbi:MFS transporter, partial [Ideonella sp.]|uniref:MFS transporter n=1 Tax=Ideonella sp. TaxID=1929293 RepID=UPI003BB70D4B
MSADPLEARGHGLTFVVLMVALSTAASAYSGSTPVLVAMMAKDWQYSPAESGGAVTAFTLGSTLGAVAVAGWIRRWHVRRILALSMALAGGANLMLALHPGFRLVVALHLIAGLGTGAANAAAVGYLVYGPTPHRDLAALTMAQSLFAALLLQAVVPGLPGGAQASGLFVLMALLMLVSWPAARQFRPTEVIPRAFRQGLLRPWGVGWILLSMFLSFASAGVVWTFMAAHAQQSGLTESTISDVLTAANVLSLLACLGVTWMARHGLYRWCVAMLLLSVVAAALLSMPLTPWRFGVGACAFLTGWTVASVIVPTLLPFYDPAGRRSALTPAVFGLGYA